MNNKPFLIHLTPTGTFFFGGEKSLAGTGNENYFVRSNYFPQQTTLLGLVRMQLLAAHGLLVDPHYGRAISKPADSAKLIGDTGFRLTHTSTYGQIAAIGPCLLARGGAFFAPMVYSSGFAFSEKKGRSASALSDDGPRTFVPDLQGFDPKNTPETYLFSTAGGPPVKLSEIYCPKTRVGITKNKKHFAWLYPDEKKKPSSESEMEGFFKQVSYYFKSEDGKQPWQFAFIAWVDENAGKKLLDYSKENPVVWLGGERSAFRFEISELEALPDLAPAFPVLEKDIIRVVLLSDAWSLPDEVYKHCLFAHAEGQDFRFLKSEVSATKNYYQRGEHVNASESLGRSDKHTLLRRGSVFYCKDGQYAALQTALEKATPFRRIGYNAFAAVRTDIQTNFFQPENQ